jgi:hypothetical protein
MADYGIYEVHYDDKEERIEEVHAITTVKIGSREYPEKIPLNRNDIIQKIRLNNTVITLYKENEGYKDGDKVIVYEVDNEKFIKTEGNNKKVDNLGELPRY